jgi:hypothetical protein
MPDDSSQTWPSADALKASFDALIDAPKPTPELVVALGKELMRAGLGTKFINCSISQLDAPALVGLLVAMPAFTTWQPRLPHCRPCHPRQAMARPWPPQGRTATPNRAKSGQKTLAQTLARDRLFWAISRDKLRRKTGNGLDKKTLENTGFSRVQRPVT